MMIDASRLEELVEYLKEKYESELLRILVAPDVHKYYGLQFDLLHFLFYHP